MIYWFLVKLFLVTYVENLSVLRIIIKKKKKEKENTNDYDDFILPEDLVVNSRVGDDVDIQNNIMLSASMNPDDDALGETSFRWDLEHDFSEKVQS